VLYASEPVTCTCLIQRSEKRPSNVFTLSCFLIIFKTNILQPQSVVYYRRVSGSNLIQIFLYFSGFCDVCGLCQLFLNLCEEFVVIYFLFLNIHFCN